jgi:hypothetical protein
LSEPANSEGTPVAATPAGRGFTAWIVAALIVGAAASEVVLLRQNRALKKRVATAQSMAVDLRDLRMRTDRGAYEATLLGRCQPLGAPARTAARPLDVAIYFALDRDCSSCIAETVAVWSEAAKTLPANVTVRGYTEVDGTNMQKSVDDMKPAFPVTSIPHFSRTLEEAGVAHTPVVLVSDPTSGRVLMTHAPVTWEKNDRAFVERVRAAAMPCGR